MGRRTFSGLLVVVFGVLVLVFKLGNARVQELFTSDVVALVAAGMCLGAGLVLLLDKVIPRNK